jgi:ATP-dependent DNA helicase RecQ
LQGKEDIYFYLKKYWGYDTFRPLQEDIILSALNNTDTLALLPTGGGKSLCFQLPGLARGGTCLVISPLIALMNDQVNNLKNKGISAVAITSAMNFKEIEVALNNAALGHVQFLYVSPERIENETFRQQLSYLPINLIAVDEAHCVSQWGYDFRPSYLKIAELRTYFPSINIIALTASATKDVVDDIQEKLHFKNQNVYRQSFVRKNIRYVVQLEENKFERLLKIIHNIGGSGIVYVRNRKKTEEISKWLVQQKISSGFYHAGLKPAERDVQQQKWIDNHIQVIVATNAFGMGIDKPDVRFVVHVDLPDSLEAYFQEAGRAGRDEKTAYATILCNETDIDSLTEFYVKNTPTEEEIKQCYQAIFNFYQIAVETGQGLTTSFDIEEIARNYNLKVLTLYNAIKCLEKEGYLTYLDSNFEPAKVMLKMHKNDLYSFQVKFPKYDPLIKVLLRSYGGLFEEYVPIKEKDIAYRSKISDAELLNQLDILNQQGVLSYLPQTTLPKLIFLQNRINLKFENIKLVHYPILKQKTLYKINTVINYVREEDICRSRLLLAYFNETEFSDCMYCDVCIKKHKAHLDSHAEIITLIKKELEINALTIDDLAIKLKQVNSKKITEAVNLMIDDDILSIDADKKLSLN